MAKQSRAGPLDGNWRLIAEGQQAAAQQFVQALAPSDMTTSSPSSGPGFVVLYRWRLHPGSEESFIQAWSQISELLRSERGSLGSRLHRGPNGIWYSYAQWPSSQVRDDAFSLGSIDQEAGERMAQAIAERLPEIVLESIADFMLPIAKNGA